MYGNVKIDDDEGTIVIRATSDDLASWAARPGAVWPCSTLRELSEGLVVTLDASSGDLIDYAPLTPERYRDDLIDGYELTAFCDDVLADASKLLAGCVRNAGTAGRAA